jgi:hypothetical protein
MLRMPQHDPFYNFPNTCGENTDQIINEVKKSLINWNKEHYLSI